MNAYRSAPTWTLTTAKRRIQEWEEAGQRANCRRIRRKWMQHHRDGNPKLQSWISTFTNTHTPPLHLTVAIWRTASAGLQMWSEIGTLTRQSRLQRQHLKNKQTQKCNINICPWNPFLPRKALPRDEGTNLRYLQISRCRQ